MDKVEPSNGYMLALLSGVKLKKEINSKSKLGKEAFVCLPSRFTQVCYFLTEGFKEVQKKKKKLTLSKDTNHDSIVKELTLSLDTKEESGPAEL